MEILKRILTYFFWTLFALVLGIGHMRIVLGPGPEDADGFDLILHLLHEYALFHIGARVGLVIAFLFILFDVFYMYKRLKNRPNSTIIRLLVLIGIAIIVGTSHYLLEKVIDVI